MTGADLRAWRTSQGLSRAALARVLHCSGQTIWLWEQRAELTPRQEQVVRLAQAQCMGLPPRRLACVLAARGWALKSIATRLGVSRRTINRYIAAEGDKK